jgi:hypothetical protein
MVSLTLLSLALGNIASIVSAVAVTPTSIEGVQPSIIRRDESIKTITLGDIGQYSNYDVPILLTLPAVKI